MSNITVKFIDRDYSVPEDLLVYLDLLDLTNDVRMALNKNFYQLLRNEEVGCIGDEQIRPEIDKQVGRFIAKLMDAGVYDRTVTDYLNGNKGFELISKVNQTALSKMKELFIQELDEYKAGVEDALYKRDSSITGMGFSIWSSSFVNHAIYAAMEASTLNKQEAAANKEYQREIDALHRSITSKHDGAKKTYIDGTYIPNMEAAIAVFAFELLDTYISDMIKNGKLDKSILSYINIDRSNDLLKNLDLSPNKEAILHKAFEACPYNLQVYGKTLNHGLMDYATYQTAQYFRQGKNILFSLVANLGEVEYPSKFKVNYIAAEKMAEFTQSGVISVLQAKTKDYVASVIKAYGDTVRMLDNRQQATKIMSELSEAAILSGSSASKGKASAYINGIVSQNVWTELTEKCGYTDLIDKIKAQVPGAESATTKRDVDLLLEDKLYPMLEEARQIRENEITKKREDEAKQKAEEAEKARLAAERNKKLKKLGLVAAIVVIIIAIASTIITKTTNAKAYQNMAGEFCVYRVINDDGEERDEFNWWLSVSKDGTMEMSSWSYAFDDTTVDIYSGALKNKADFRRFEDYRIEDYCADISEYEEALYCYEFHIADEWDEFDGYIVCWQYHNGKIVDVYCDDYRYSFVETSDDYSFSKWEGEINSDNLSKNVQKLIDNIDVSEEDIIEEIENLISSGSYDKAVEAIVASKLSDQQKNAYYDSLVKKIDFTSFDVNGLVINIPEHWYIEDYSDPYIRSARDSEEGSLLTWYIKCMGTIDQVVRDGDDGWRRDNDYSLTTVAGCEEAYIRRELSKEVDVDEVYSVIDYYVVCQGFVYKIQYFAYDERFFEPEMHMLWERVGFTNYAENRADIQEQKYLDAIELFDEGKYEEALSVFVTLEGYKESEQKITECNNAITDGKYNNAIALINEGKYKDALVLLDEVSDYKDAVALKQKYALLACEAGDVITFGVYEQDNNLDNGAEAIEWVVLERDGNKAFVISKYCIEWLPFHNTITEVGWKNSSIRSWLNNTFLNGAFTAQEKKSIISTQHTNPDFYDDGESERNWLGTTTDTVFLLSSGEADKYFPSDSARQAEGTEYACSKGKSASWYWWLRSANNIEYAGFVSEGELGYGEEVDRNMGIRPAMWIEISE